MKLLLISLYFSLLFLVSCGKEAPQSLISPYQQKIPSALIGRWRYKDELSSKIYFMNFKEKPSVMLMEHGNRQDYYLINDFYSTSLGSSVIMTDLEDSKVERWEYYIEEENDEISLYLRNEDLNEWVKFTKE